MEKTTLLDPLFLSKIRAVLVKEAATLEKELDGMRESAQFGSGEDDLSQQVEATFEATSLRERLANLLSAVKRSLLRIDQGEYGRCGICQAPIEKARLEAWPLADSCVSCAQKTRR